MKTLYTLIILGSFIFSINYTAHSQGLLKKLTETAKEKVEEKMEEKAEQEAEKKLDEKLDELFELDDEETDAANDAARQERMQKMLQGFGMSGEPVPIADNYKFDHLLHMHIENFDKNNKKKDEGEFITHFNPKTKSMAYEVVSGDMADAEQGLFIIDTENDAMIILSHENNEKTGIVYGIGTFFQTLGETYHEEDMDDSETPDSYLANPNVDKTGRTKNIAGYKCEEYIYSDEETESQVWITKDLKMNMYDFFSTLFKTSLYSHGMPWGTVMEATTEDKSTGEKSTMQVVNVDDKSNKSFALNEYEITNLGSFQMPAATEEE